MAILNLGIAVRFAADDRANRCLQQDRGKLAGTATGGLLVVETLKASGADDFFARWAGFHTKVFNAEQELERVGRCAFVGIPPILGALNAAAIHRHRRYPTS